MNLPDEIDALRRALAGVDHALKPLLTRPALARPVRRLEADLRRMLEDVDDLTAEAPAASSAAVPLARDVVPVPIPPRDDVVTYDPEAEDEGLAGWRRPAVAPPPRVRRRR